MPLLSRSRYIASFSPSSLEEMARVAFLWGIVGKEVVPELPSPSVLRMFRGICFCGVESESLLLKVCAFCSGFFLFIGRAGSFLVLCSFDLAA